jgi:O-antigen ligase
VILGFVPGLLNSFEAPKAALLRVIGTGLLAAVMVEAVSRYIRARGPRGGAGGESQRPWDGTALAMDLAVVAWVVSAVLSTVTSMSPRLSLLGEIEQREGLLTTIGLTGLYASARRWHHDIGDVRRTLDVILACIALCAVYAMVQFSGLDPLAWTHTAAYPAGAANVLRPFATLGSPIALGALLAVALGTGVSRLASGRGHTWRLITLVVVVAIALLATLSRGAWLAGLVATGAALSGARYLDAHRLRIHSSRALVLAAAIVIAWGAIALRAPVTARVLEDVRGGAVSTPARAEIARAALSLVRDHPWFGCGLDTFGLMFPRVQTTGFWSREWGGLPVHAHSAALQILATGGAAGAIAGSAWLVVLAAASFAAWRARGEPRGAGLDLLVALVALVAAGVFYPVGPAGAALFVTLSALIVRTARVGNAVSSSRRRMPRGAWLVGLLLAGLLAIPSMRELQALAAARHARDALGHSIVAGNELRPSLLDRASRYASEAAVRAPGEDRLWRLYCDAELARAREAVAQDDSATAVSAAVIAEESARHALRLEPHRASNLQRLGNAVGLQARLAFARGSSKEVGPLGERPDGGAPDRVDSVFAQARRYAPVDPLILVDQTRAQLELNRPGAALATAHRIVTLYPEAAAGYALEAASWMMLGRNEEVRSALRHALAAHWEDGSESEHMTSERYLRALDDADSTGR